MAEAVIHRVVAALAELQPQITGLMAIVQGIKGHQALDLTEEQPEDAIRLQAGLQLHSQLLAKLRDGRRAARQERWLAKSQALQFGTVEVNCVGLGRCFHKRSASKLLAVLQAR